MPRPRPPHPARARNQAAARQQTDFGNACAQRGAFGEAGAHYRQAIAFDPDCAEAFNNLGNIYRETGDIALAAASFKRAAEIRPDFAMAHNNLGIALREMGRLDDAEARHRHALSLEPHYAEAHFNLGNVLSDRGQYDAARDCFLRAIRYNPRYAEAYMNLGNMLRLQDKFAEAGECYRRAAAIRPDYAEANHNLGNMLLTLDRPNEAGPCFQRALALRPDYAEAYLSFGIVLARFGKREESLHNYRRALSFKPDYAEAHTNAALANLALGNFAEGWPEYEWRWWLADMAPVQELPVPLWDGKDFSGKTILLYCEQGFGDSLQFIRYAPLVKEKGGQLILACPQPLLRLFESVEGVDRLAAEDARMPACDWRAPLLSLPMFFETRLENIPARIPYLAPPLHLADLWAYKLRPYKGLKVGLVWAGNARAGHATAHAVDRRRSLKLEQFALLADIPNVSFFSLQKGPPGEEAKNPPPGMEIVDLMDTVGDFADTAALIANLDLVIGVDTSVIHLAGAMGKPVWVLSRFDGCWRWLTGRDDSPWYPTLRLFRQPQPGEWPAAIEAVTEALKNYAK